MTSVTRRGFLLQAGCIGGGVALASRLGPFAFGGEKEPDAWPVRVTCRDVALRPTGKPDCWSALQAVGAEGVEVVVGDNDLTLPHLHHPTVKYSLTPEEIDRLAADLKAAGQRISAFCMANRFETRPDFEIKHCVAVAQAAQKLGVPAIRIDVVPAKLGRAAFLKQVVGTLKQMIAATETTGVNFAIENHSNTTNDPEVLAALFDGVGSQRLGLTLDTANFYWFGHPLAKVYSLCETMAPRAMHTHCKNIRYPAAEREKQRPMGWKYVQYGRPADDGDIDFARVAAFLKKAGYRNDLCIEDEFLSKDPAATTARLIKEIDYLKQVRAVVWGK
ncbi:MAG: sugar phosphate isomerase/epimerase family protein [Thermoguttaceae bacterium]